MRAESLRAMWGREQQRGSQGFAGRSGSGQGIEQSRFKIGPLADPFERVSIPMLSSVG
jgi:hypothetical protein